MLLCKFELEVETSLYSCFFLPGRDGDHSLIFGAGNHHNISDKRGCPSPMFQRMKTIAGLPMVREIDRGTNT